jgi:hypothetical protein
VLDEGIGEVTGRIGVRNTIMTFEVEAASPRLAVSGTGRIALTPESDAELTFRFTDTSVDPYARLAWPGLSPFTTAVATGSLRVVGELRNLQHLVVDAVVDDLQARLFDYGLRNDGAIRLLLDNETVQIASLRLVGDNTSLNVTGEVAIGGNRIALDAEGEANLGILQGFYRDIRSSGEADLRASVRGPLDAPVLAGTASIAGGRVRHFALPHSLDAVNGRIVFDAEGARLDGLTGRLGGGLVRFGGRIGLAGYEPVELNVTASGESMRLRYPEGFRSVVDAELALRGRFEAPLLSGSVLVRSSVLSRRIDLTPSFMELAGGGGGAALPQPSAPTGVPLRFDIRLVAPSSLRIENNVARIVSSADLTLRGSYDRPLVFGRAEIERGEVLFEGRRYIVTRGTVDFSNPTRIEPFFDIETETRVRVPGQTYRVAMTATGTFSRLQFSLDSDPPLANVEILGLLLGNTAPTDPELAQLRSPQQTEQQLLQARAAQLLVSPLSAGVGRVVEQAFGVDSFQITPSLSSDPLQQSSRLNPSARLTIGKRLSSRAYLTFSQSLTQQSTNRDQVILLEYDQTDRLSWVLSQNEDRTYALEDADEARVLMRRAPGLVLWLVLLLPAAVAAQDGGALMGRTVERLVVELDGVRTSDAALLDLIETRPGAPLQARAVRESVAHLFGLGRFDDVRVHATAVDGGGVLVRYELIGARNLSEVRFTGTLGIGENELRRALAARFGLSASVTRAGDVTRFLEGFYQDRGHLQARVTVPETGSSGGGPLVLHVEAGPRATVSAVRVEGNAPGTLARARSELGLSPGQPYDARRVAARLAEYVASLRQQGYYEAQAEHDVLVAADQRSVELVVTIDAGAHVTVIFEGDPVPPRVRRDLVPIEREGSVDEDLLEDVARNIADHFRAQGYRDASVTFRRTDRNGELAIVFRVDRGPAYRVGTVEMSGNATVPLADLSPPSACAAAPRSSTRSSTPT